MSLALDVDVSGPLIDGRLERAIDAGVEEGLDDVADEGVNLVRARLHGMLRHPTGRYDRNIQTDRAGASRVVDDGNIVYGPWLEGTSRRNETTRFKGYATFRRTTAELDRASGPIMERAIGRRIGSL